MSHVVRHVGVSNSIHRRIACEWFSALLAFGFRKTGLFAARARDRICLHVPTRNISRHQAVAVLFFAEPRVCLVSCQRNANVGGLVDG